ncbi:methyltransferase [Calycina marina]|uniref:Methyltransferase n=1 Tax=Calycina marina TaxID=1763456 RepID=A0A9P8CGL5_9HELO|nr:methyltransferase [Calycina marina]
MSNFALPSAAQTGFSNAPSYDAYRQSYPPASINTLLAHLGIYGQKGARVVDLGCGTGKFTGPLSLRPEEYEIIAVEPHEGMRRTLEEKVLKGVRVMEGYAEGMVVEEGWADACVAAQAFHWFATDEALKEIHRVLRPGAVFGMIWNIEDFNGAKAWETTSKWEQELKDIILETNDGLPRFRDMKWKEAFESQQQKTLLTLYTTYPKFSLPLGEETIKWTVWLGDDAIWARFLTFSQIANQEDEEKEKIKQRVMKSLKDESTERNEKGEIAVHGVTYLAWTSRV